jgi:hypothetical protein
MKNKWNLTRCQGDAGMIERQTNENDAVRGFMDYTVK